MTVSPMARHRPDLFGNVISWVGSFANIRGGQHFPWLVRNTPRKETIRRVFLQDGTADADNNNGDQVSLERSDQLPLHCAINPPHFSHSRTLNTCRPALGYSIVW